MACFGAITPGQTGHPFAGQTLAVRRAPNTSTSGVTGASTASVGVFFGVLPPSVSGATSLVDFTRYGTRAIPTSLTLPCAGTSTVYFVPLPVEPSKLYAVPVSFVGQP